MAIKDWKSVKVNTADKKIGYVYEWVSKDYNEEKDDFVDYSIWIQKSRYKGEYDFGIGFDNVIKEGVTLEKALESAKKFMIKNT